MSDSCNCDENADINADIIFHCKNCSNEIERFQIKKPLKAAGIAAILAYGGSQFIDYAITDNRYPLDIEYEILNACSNSYREPVSYRVYGSRNEICLCAMEDTMNEISYIRYKVSEQAFLKAFDKNAENCQK
ncbi:hypothetical protein NBRC116188_06100 [Oceaniserpentilla sp. 4NH20-0058]|uniref:hypothetical protein n=1 Tax=Oceaniserpentilla sp. 4NH20-0058 TaxID=3127660 RepID=UPI0031083233